jgi:hypothetical protein
MFPTSILDEVTAPRFNPTAVVDQLQMLPAALPTLELVDEIEAAFHITRRQREGAMASLAALMADQTYRNDGEEFSTIIASFEKHADEIGRKLYALEKRVQRAQKADASRNTELDARLLNVARQDFEDRIDVSVFWRALQARIWPSPTSDSHSSGQSIGDALRAALG